MVLGYEVVVSNMRTMPSLQAVMNYLSTKGLQLTPKTGAG
jgi:hypothetical protein